MRKHIYILPLLIFSLFSFSSCFTGVEGTKKISLSKDDKRLIKPSPEDAFLDSVSPAPLTLWNKGKLFCASDDKAALIFDQMGLPSNPLSLRLKGKYLSFESTEIRKGLDGSQYLYIIFSDGNRSFAYNTGKDAESAGNLLSSDIPMLIDMDMVKQADKLIGGRTLWTRTALWYDSTENKTNGRKYVPVMVKSVSPGNLVFPLRINFKDENNTEASLFINFGNSPTDSRSFSNIFSLSDIRKKFPHIRPETWNLICNEKITKGMTKEECKLALGNPSELSAGHDYNQTLDLWHYPDGTVLWFEDGLLSRFRK